MNYKLGSPEAMRQEPSLDPPDYFDPPDDDEEPVEPEETEEDDER